MRLYKKLFSFLVLTAFSLTQVHAYIPAHLGGEGAQTQESRTLQVQSAVLLGENGTPRCFVGTHPGEYLTAKQLEDFYAANSSISPDTFDGLRECDQGDKLAVLGDEEISLGLAVPTFARALLGGAGIGAGFGCSFASLNYILGGKIKNVFFATVSGISSLVVFMVSGAMLPMFVFAVIKIGGAVAIGGPLASLVGIGTGTDLCHKLSTFDR